MSSEVSGMVSMPDFLRVLVLVEHKQMGVIMRINASLNPFQITSYHQENIPSNDGEEIEATGVYVGGAHYSVDMPYTAFDKLVSNINRGTSIEFAENV
jgi:hypothetical protein